MAKSAGEHYLEDTQGLETSLHYLRTKDGKELDFLVCIDHKPTHLIEVKMSDDTPVKGFAHFSRYFDSTQCIQLVKILKREKTYPNGLELRALIPWLKDFQLS
jgi:hypothetical protein